MDDQYDQDFYDLNFEYEDSADKNDNDDDAGYMNLPPSPLANVDTAEHEQNENKFESNVMQTSTANHETASQNDSDEELDKNQDIEIIKGHINNQANNIDSQSIGIGEGNVFESDIDSEEEKDQVMPIRNPISSLPTFVEEDDTLERLMAMNKKLIEELGSLIQAIEIQMYKVKENKEKKIEQIRNRDKGPKELQDKDKELIGAQKKASKLSKEISNLKRRIRGAHGEGMLKELQNEYTDKIGEIELLEKDIKAANNVRKQQQKALTNLNNEGVSDEYLSKYKENVVQSKQELKTLTEEWRKQDKELKSQHTISVELEQKCRVLENHIRKTRSKSKAKTIDNSDSEVSNRDNHHAVSTSASHIDLDDEIEQLKQEIAEIEQRENSELEHKKKILESVCFNKSEIVHIINSSQLKMKEKNQEEKLNDLKAKELKRSVPHRQLFVKPLRRNQSQNERPSSKSKMKANTTSNSEYKGRNPSSSRIPNIRASKKKKGKNLRMNVSVDAYSKSHHNSSEDMPEEGHLNCSTQNAKKEISLSDVKRDKISNGYKGYTPTGIPPRPS